MTNTELPQWRRQQLEVLADHLGIRFNDIGWLHQALTHTSYAKETHSGKKKQLVQEHNERLEFLGDAVLELAVSDYLFDRKPELPEGRMTKSRAAIVCGASLSKRAAQLHLGEHLMLSKGEQQSGGAQRLSNLEDAFEAVIGAIYKDQGWFVAQEYVLRQLDEALKNYHIGQRSSDYKSMLQELAQKQEKTVSYNMLSAVGPDHAKEFEFSVLVDGVEMAVGAGNSKKSAQQQAAQKALEIMKAAHE